MCIVNCVIKYFCFFRRGIEDTTEMMLLRQRNEVNMPIELTEAMLSLKALLSFCTKFIDKLYGRL